MVELRLTSGYLVAFCKWVVDAFGYGLQAVAVKQKYDDALELLRSLPGIDTSLMEQEAAIVQANEELKRISYVFLCR